MKGTRHIIACIMLVVGITKPATAGIPVIDGANLAQSIMEVMESIAQTTQQIEQYRTQLEQYENQLINTTAPAYYIWDDATATIDGLMEAMDTLAYYETRLGSLEAYLDQYQDLNHYATHPCAIRTCTASEMASYSENDALASEANKNATDALFKTIDTQQRSLTTDARQLERLQSRAQTAQGQLEAVQYANQLASQQASQLLQIRALLLAQQTAAAVKQQQENDEEARRQAIRKKRLGL